MLRCSAMPRPLEVLGDTSPDPTEDERDLPKVLLADRDSQELGGDWCEFLRVRFCDFCGVLTSWPLGGIGLLAAGARSASM